MPNVIWRISDSPVGSMLSDSTHIPPTGNESSFLDALQHAREQVWMFLFHPRILLGGTHRVREIRILVHQGKHVGHRAGHFTVGFAHGSQPCGIDMRMADRDMMDDAGICGFG